MRTERMDRGLNGMTNAIGALRDSLLCLRGLLAERPRPAQLKRAPKAFLARRDAVDPSPYVHGYPDECAALGRFARALSRQLPPARAHAPVASRSAAIAIDFVSATQSHAEASLAHGWDVPWDAPVGAAATVHARTETNEQNARIDRHVLLLAPAMTMIDFHARALARIIDEPPHPAAMSRAGSPLAKRDLAGAFALLAAGTGASDVHLFATWTPDARLVERLSGDGVRLIAHRLDEIAPAARASVRAVSIWRGTVAQSREFLATVWRADI